MDPIPPLGCLFSFFLLGMHLLGHDSLAILAIAWAQPQAEPEGKQT